MAALSLEGALLVAVATAMATNGFALLGLRLQNTHDRTERSRQFAHEQGQARRSLMAGSADDFLGSLERAAVMYSRSGDPRKRSAKTAENAADALRGQLDAAAPLEFEAVARLARVRLAFGPDSPATEAAGRAAAGMLSVGAALERVVAAYRQDFSSDDDRNAYQESQIRIYMDARKRWTEARTDFARAVRAEIDTALVVERGGNSPGE